MIGWFPNLTRAYDNNGRCPRQKFVFGIIQPLRKKVVHHCVTRMDSIVVKILVYMLGQLDIYTFRYLLLRGLGGVVVIDASIGEHGRGSRPAHYITVAATLDKSLTSHCL